MCAVMSNTSSLINKSTATSNLSFFYQGLEAPSYFFIPGLKNKFPWIPIVYFTYVCMNMYLYICVCIHM